jgi:hypothetical protein
MSAADSVSPDSRPVIRLWCRQLLRPYAIRIRRWRRRRPHSDGVVEGQTLTAACLNGGLINRRPMHNALSSCAFFVNVVVSVVVVPRGN